MTDLLTQMDEVLANLTTSMPPQQQQAKAMMFLLENNLALRAAVEDSQRLDWIIDNCTTEGGGTGCLLKVWIAHDSECIRAAIDAARWGDKP